MFFGGLMLSNHDNIRIQIVGNLMLIITGILTCYLPTVKEKLNDSTEHENPNEVLECEILNEKCQTVDTIFVIYKNGNVVGSFIKK